MGSTVSCQISALAGLQCNLLSDKYIHTDVTNTCGTTTCFQKLRALKLSFTGSICILSFPLLKYMQGWQVIRLALTASSLCTGG